jgi:hypothetical protein
MEAQLKEMALLTAPSEAQTRQSGAMICKLVHVIGNSRHRPWAMLEGALP